MFTTITPTSVEGGVIAPTAMPFLQRQLGGRQRALPRTYAKTQYLPPKRWRTRGVVR